MLFFFFFQGLFVLFWWHLYPRCVIFFLANLSSFTTVTKVYRQLEEEENRLAAVGFLLSSSSLKTCTVNTSTWVVGAAGHIWRQWPEGERTFGWAVCPLGAVTSQALHSFILQGQIPVTEPGRQRRNGPCRLPSWGLSELEWRSHETKRANLKSFSVPSAQVAISRQVGQINGLKSNNWATHYPPVSPLSSLAPPKLHINLQKVTISPSLLRCPAVCLA